MKNTGLFALGLGALALTMANSNNEANATVNGSNLAFTGGDVANVDSALVNAVIEAIKNSPSLRQQLKGEKGSAGAAGATGAVGPAGAAGSSIQNFAGSLITNGALELGTLSNWPAGTSIGELYEGMPTLVCTYDQSKHMNNSSECDIDNRRLYKLTCSAKGTAIYRFFLRRLDKDHADIIQNAIQYIYALGAPSFSNTSFEQKVVYFGGTDTSLTTSIGINTVRAKVSILANSAGVVTISKLKLQMVPLGEPVPYNLAYLPENQVVYEPTTGKLGRFNGTAVVWNG